MSLALGGEVVGVAMIAGKEALLIEAADRPWGVRMFHFKDLDAFKLGVSTPHKG